jgi:tetratricopeptide (TPR) repeat protein
MLRLIPVLLLLAPAAFGAGELDKARQQYSRAMYREAIQTLASTSEPAAYELTGKSWFVLAEYKRAQEAFEKAVAAAPNNSVYFHWLGKAYGRRAETSNPLSAPMLASKARQNFEKAVELDGKNLEAINDLFSYYMEAPGFLGGGIDKAENLAKKIQALDPVEYHYAMAQIAEKRKDIRTAEHHFRQAFQMAPKSVGRAIDLASFLSKHGRVQESEVIFAQAQTIAPNNPRLLFERASAYVRAKKNLAEAQTLLQQYLRSPLSPDDPPRAEAERLLKQAQSGA